MEGSNIDIGYICLSAVTAAVQDDQFLSSNTTSIFVVNYSSSSNNLDYFSTNTEAKKVSYYTTLRHVVGYQVKNISFEFYYHSR